MKKAMKQSTLTLILNGVSILVLLLTVLASIFASLASNAANRAHNDRFELTYNANRFMDASSYLTNEVRAYAATGNRQHYDNYWNEVNNLKNREAGKANMEEIGLSQEEEGYLGEMAELSDALVPLESAAMEDVAAGREDHALTYVYGAEYSAAVAKISTLQSAFLEALDRRSETEVEHYQTLSRALQVAVYVALFLVAVVQVITIFVVRRKLIRPVTEIEQDMIRVSQGTLRSEFNLEPDASEIGMLVEALLKTKAFLHTMIDDVTHVLNNMAEGDMDQAIRAYYSNDFWPIKIAVNKILDALNDALARIMESSQRVAGSAAQVSDGAHALSEGASQQASAVEELTATVNDISGHIKEIADHASKARAFTLEAGREVDNGNRSMQELTGAMEAITNSSLRISGIIKAIEDIAFQTNILALNAAVEASRAGQAGKGFAVVADEVRSLADKSSEAAKDSTALIEETIRLVENGSALATQTAQALGRVVTGTAQSADYVDKIAGATEQQAEALQQVTEGLEQISSVIQNNAAAAQESAASAAELTRQADTQKALVGRFHLRASAGQ